MLQFTEKYIDKGKFSQNGEAGIIKELLRRIKPKLKVAVEFGAADGFYLSNTADLPVGWKRHLYDKTPSGKEGKVTAMTITPSNVNLLPDCSVLSIDIDGDDYSVWKAYNGKPAIVVIEINSDYPPTARILDRGTSYAPMVELAKEKGYMVVAHVGNLICVDEQYRELFPELEGVDPISDSDKFFNTSWLKPELNANIQKSGAAGAIR